MKILFDNRWMKRVSAGTLCLAALSATSPLARASSSDLPKLLEQAIYSEDSKGDLDSAMTLYKRVVSEGTADQALAAQAEYRLALCYEKKRDHAAAAAAFARIAQDFPSQKTYVALANEHLAAGLPLEAAPWQDGEEMVLQLRASTGVKAGSVKYSIHRGELKGRPVWKFSSQAFNGGSAQTTMTADADTLKPLNSEVRSGRMLHITTTYGNGFAEIEGLGPTGNKHVELAGPFYDNEEVIELLRRLPLAVGYKVSLRIAAATANGTIIPAEMTVVGKESIVVPAGTFDAFKVTTSIGQTYWFTADTHKYFAKMEMLGGGMELTFAGVPSTEPVVYHDKLMKFQLSFPHDWMFSRQQDDADTRGSTIIASDPQGLCTIMFKVLQGKEFPDEAKASARAFADHQSKDGPRWYKDYKVRGDSWTDSKIDGIPAVGCIVDAVVNSGFHTQIENEYAVSGDRVLDFELLSDPGDVLALKPTFDSVAKTFRFE